MNEEEMLMVVMMEDVQDAEEQEQQPGREFLDRKDAFQLSDVKFVKYFRLTKELTRFVIQLVTPYMQNPSRTSALSIETKVLITLRFYGTGSYQEIIGTNIYTGVSQAAVSRTVGEVSDALGRPEIFNQFIQFPPNIQALINLRNRFFVKYRLPGIVGIIDCTHVAIVRPPSNDPDNPEHIYINRKQYHSINVQLICDENLKVINVNSRFPGSSHDAFIWSQSQVSHTMEQIYRNDGANLFYLLGDSGYPLRPWLLTPIEEAPPNTPEERFNDRFKSIRSIIERCNGCLKNRFRCLLKHRVLHYRPLAARKIINACIVLHNLCIEHNIPEPDYDEDIGLADWGMYPPQAIPQNIGEGRVNPDLAAARQLQRNLANRYFRNIGNEPNMEE